MADPQLTAYIDEQLNGLERCRTAAIGSLVEGGGSLRSSRVVSVVSGQAENSVCALFVYKYLGAKPSKESVYSLDGVYCITETFAVTLLNGKEREEHQITEPDTAAQAVRFSCSADETLTFLFPADQSFLYLLKEINGAVRAGFGKTEADLPWIGTYNKKVLKRASMTRAVPHVETGALIDLSDGGSTSSTSSRSPSSTRRDQSHLEYSSIDSDVTNPFYAPRSRTYPLDEPLNEPLNDPHSRHHTQSAGTKSYAEARLLPALDSPGLRRHTMQSSSCAETSASGTQVVGSLSVLRDNSQAASSDGRLTTDGKKKRDILGTAVAVSKSPMTIMRRAGKVVGSPRSSQHQAGQPATSRTTALGMPSYSRHSFLGMKMAQREDQFTYKQSFKVFCGTWNVNGQYPKEGLQPWLGMDAEPPDVYAVGFQELDLSAEALLLNDSSREDEWIRAIQVGLNKKAGARYQKVKQIRLVGMLMVVYVQEKHADYIQDVEAQMAGTGLMGMMGNKGGVAIRFQFHNTYICFVNSHLAAHADQVEKRNQDYAEVLSRLEFSDGKTILDHNTVFWMGDLNYRLIGDDIIDDTAIRDMATAENINELSKLDQLHQERARGNVFSGFSEGAITFGPTYKFDPGTDNWDSSEKNRPPAWCDRVLWCGSDVEQLVYRSHPALKLSDHKPVSSVYNVQISVVDVEKHRQVFDEVSREMDRLENDSIPVASLATNELVFGDVRYREEKSRTLVVSNIGQVPMQFSFIPKLNEHAYCRPWLWIKPAVGFVYPNKSVKITMTMFVDTESVASLASVQEKLEDILIFHLEGGKDYFVSITGRFVKTCFGMGLEPLLEQKMHMREVPVADLLGADITSSAMTNVSTIQSRVQIPKELVWLIEYITERGIDEENLFMESGTRQDFLQLTEFLDTGSGVYTGPVNTTAEALLLFLEALPEPVIPFLHYQRCMEASNQYLLCRQVLSKLPPLNQRVFMYVLKFLKDLIAHVDKNKLEAKLLATVFGTVLIRPPKDIAARLASSKRSQASASKKASAFLYHFLVER